MDPHLSFFVVLFLFLVIEGGALGVDIKPLAQIARKFITVTPGRTAEYEQGINAPRRSWATAAAAASDAWKAGVTAAAAGNRFATGVGKAGDAKWKRGAIAKGVVRFGPGVQASEADYTAGFQPYFDVISRTALPVRRAKGDPQNIQRVAVIAKALHDQKIGGGR